LTKSKFFIFIVWMLILFSNVYALISPVRRNRYDRPILINSNDIQLLKQRIDLYHHPLGIWIVHCHNVLKNLYPREVTQEIAFNSGFDIEVVETELLSSEFNNFQVYVNGQEVHELKMKERCTNYVDRIGIEWSNDDRTGIGFVNTWKVEFGPEEVKEIDISFNFIVKKPPVIYDAGVNENWYNELMSWMKLEYSKRAENDFVLPLNMGSFWALSVDTLLIRHHYSDNWLMIENPDSIEYQPEQTVTHTHTEPIDLYSPPPVELGSIEESELSSKSKTELQLMRHAFFAKYGRGFENKWLKLFFENQSWYRQDSTYDNWYLTEFDITNMKKIFEYEQERYSNRSEEKL